MTPRETLLPCVLLALCWGPLPASAQGPSPLQTLRCYNDYTNRIQCRWAEPPGTCSILGLTLMRRLNDKPPKRVSCEPSEDLSWLGTPCQGCVSRHCEIPYKPFVLADHDYFSLQPDRPLGVQLTVTLAQHVQPPTPKDLQVRAVQDGFLMTWNVAQSPWLPTLEFEVAYRKLQDSWEDASTVYTSSSHVVLARQLLPRGSYLARVRAQLTPDSGLSGQPSRWSAEVSWDSWDGDEAQPHNLQCLFDGAHALSCSWEVSSEVVRAVSFSLFYKSSPSAEEEECAPVRLERRDSGYTWHGCEIRVAAPERQSRYLVTVRPRLEEKLIKSSDNIQMARPTLNVTKAGDSYSLSWTTEKMMYDHITHTFQVQYKSKDIAWEDAEKESLQNAHSMALPLLEPGTRYQARVRVKPTPGEYNGIWSEWSKEGVWDTEWALPTWGLALILVFVTLALVPALRFCGVYGYRLNRKWEEKIPNPGKSLLFQNGGAGLWFPASPPALGDRHSPHQDPRLSLLSELQEVVPGDLGRSEVSPLTTEDPGSTQEAPTEPAPTPATPTAPCPPPGAPKCSLPGWHFNGPYLGLPHSRSLPNLGALQAHPQPGSCPQPRPAGSLDYLCVPLEGPSLQSGAARAPGAAQGAQDSPPAVATSVGDPEHGGATSDYVTTTHLPLCPPPWGPASSQDPGLCPGLPRGGPGAPIPMKAKFGDYLELPPTSGHAPGPPLPSPAPPPASGAPLGPGEPSAAPAHPEELLVLQQVGDYCFLPGPGQGPPPDAGPPAPTPGTGDPAAQSKKPPGPAAPQLPAIQLFKALKQQDYLVLPRWDGSRLEEVH